MADTTDSSSPRAPTAEHPNAPISSERIALVVSLVALIFTAMGLYFQFFHATDELNASKVNYNYDNNRVSLGLAIMNSGTRQALVTDIYPVVYQDFRTVRPSTIGPRVVIRGVNLDSVARTRDLPITIGPGEIQFVTLDASFNPSNYYTWGNPVSSQFARSWSTRKVQIGVHFTATSSSGKTFNTVHPFVEFYIEQNGQSYLHYNPGLPLNLFRESLY